MATTRPGAESELLAHVAAVLGARTGDRVVMRGCPVKLGAATRAAVGDTGLVEERGTATTARGWNRSVIWLDRTEISAAGLLAVLSSIGDPAPDGAARLVLVAPSSDASALLAEVGLAAVTSESGFGADGATSAAAARVPVQR